MERVKIIAWRGNTKITEAFTALGIEDCEEIKFLTLKEAFSLGEKIFLEYGLNVMFYRGSDCVRLCVDTQRFNQR